MDFAQRLILAGALLVVALPASAFYREPSPPPGTTIRPGGGTTFRPTSPVPGTGRIPGGSATINIGNGRTVTRPITWRPGPGAGRAIATGIVRGGLWGLGFGLAEWAADQCIHAAPGGGLLLRCGEPDDPYLPGQLVYQSHYVSGKDYGSAGEACEDAVKTQSGESDAKYRLEAAASGVEWLCYRVFEYHDSLMTSVFQTYRCGDNYSTTGKCALPDTQPEGRPIDEETAINMLSGKIPPTIPPGIDIPVTAPVWNPAGPGSDRTKPVIVPVGDPIATVGPQPAPGVSPVAPKPGATKPPGAIEWQQPAVEITHSPTPDNPLRVDVKPINVPVESPRDKIKPETDGKPQAVPKPGQKPGEKPADPTVDPSIDPALLPDKKKDGEGEDGKPADDKTGDLCRKNPDILACKKLEELEPEDLENRTVDVALRPADGFARAGHCPADRVMTVLGQQVTWSWSSVCDLARGVRPVVVAFAAIAAVGIVVGASRRT
nr:MAG TPA: attachment protein [Inoviridae sp.]